MWPPQAALQARLDATKVWDAHGESYPSQVQQRLELFYQQVLTDGAARPDAKRAVAHFGGNIDAINQALRAKCACPLSPAPSSRRVRLYDALA